MDFFDFFKPKNQSTFDLTDFKFLSDNHNRYENTYLVPANNKGSWRGVRIKSNNNSTYEVTIYNINGQNPIWRDNIQMAPKTMTITSQSNEFIKLQGVGHDHFGQPYKDYALTILIENKIAKKCILHLLDRKIDIEYLSPNQKEILQNNQTEAKISVFVNGDSYAGDYMNGKIHGKGTYVFANSQTLIKYIGEFEFGRRSGFGTLYYKDGATYVGHFRNDLREGKGKQAYANGEVYQGDFFEEMRHGHGKYTYPDGEYYEGQFVFSKYQGEGVYHFADGRIYTGSFSNDLFHGYGVLKNPWSQVIQEGVWHYDKLIEEY